MESTPNDPRAAAAEALPSPEPGARAPAPGEPQDSPSGAVPPGATGEPVGHTRDWWMEAVWTRLGVTRALLAGAWHDAQLGVVATEDEVRQAVERWRYREVK